MKHRSEVQESGVEKNVEPADSGTKENVLESASYQEKVSRRQNADMHLGEQTIVGRYSTDLEREVVPQNWATFKLYRRGAVTTYSLDADKTTTFVGTDPEECDLVFKDSRVSEKQLAITRIDDDYVLTDCGRKDLISFNGIPSRQVICPVGSKCVVNMNDSTMIFDTVKHHQIGTTKQALRYRLTGENIMRPTDVGAVTFLMGPQKIKLELEPMLIGSCAACTLMLSDKMLQPFHVMFHWTSKGVCVTRLSRGIVLVNGVEIEKSKILTLTDRVQLGGATFTMSVEGTIEGIAKEIFSEEEPEFENFRFSPLPCSASPAFKIPILGGDVMVGRSETAGVMLDDEGLSRQHVQLIPNGKTCLAIDNYSANGTFVNGEAISKSRMRVGDLLEIGRNIFLLHFE